MEARSLTLGQLAAQLRSPAAAEALSPAAGVCCVRVDASDEEPVFPSLSPHCPIVAVTRTARHDHVIDVRADSEEQADSVVAAIRRNPFAATLLTRLLRHNERAGVDDALFAESLAYSSLQHGAEFRSWRRAWRAKPRESAPRPRDPPVRVDRAGDALRVTLNRPDKRNAYSTAMRDALCEALALAAEDDTIRAVALAGAGPCFCAGGDLDEFGAAADAALAHVARTTRSAAALIHRLRERVVARLHGACIGAGVELPAFAGRVLARQDAFFQLPEVSMGLVPGAGGTVSILSRVGRHRLAFMALTGARVDAETALAWGLVDGIE